MDTDQRVVHIKIHESTDGWGFETTPEADAALRRTYKRLVEIALTLAFPRTIVTHYVEAEGDGRPTHVTVAFDHDGPPPSWAQVQAVESAVQAVRAEAWDAACAEGAE